jgi:hypothetical protein
MKPILYISSALLIFTMTAINAQRDNDSSAAITKMIGEIEQLRDNSPANEHSAFETTIDSLTRLRDHGSWPVINSPVAITSIQNTKWKMSPDKNGFQQTISFSGSTGQWLRTPGTLPFSFNWQIESDRIRLSYSSSYKEAFSYQIVDRTYQYQLNGNELTMKRADSTLAWQIDADPK